MIRNLLFLALVVSVTYAARSFIPQGGNVTGSGTALAFGFLIIASIAMGHIGQPLRLPQLTGFIICGLLFGPEVLGLVTREMVGELGLIKGTAVGLIALLAGCELNFRRLRPQLRAILSLSAATFLITAAALFATFWWIVAKLPIAAGFSPIERAAVALVCANILAAYSPAVVIGIITETRSAGPLTDLSISIVVIADLLIVITFTFTSLFAKNVFPDLGGVSGVLPLIVHFVGSIVAGAAFALAVVVYVNRVGTRTGLLLFALLFVVAEVGPALHLDPLLVGLTAGLIIENATPIGGAAITHAAAPVALPTFAVFFSVIGAEIPLRAFLHVAPFAVAAAVVRAVAITIGTFLGARFARVPARLTRAIPLALVSQAGVAIALAILLVANFGTWGRVAGTIVLGTIVVNQIIGPVLFRAALVRAGETNAAEGETENGEEPAAAQ